MTKTIIDFNPDTETVVLLLKEEDRLFAVQLLEDGWKWDTRENGTKILKRRWYKGIEGFLLTLFPKTYFTHTFVERANS